MWKDQRFVFEGNGIVLLSEGMADRRFFSKLAKHHKLPKIDFPWPVEEDEDASRDTKKFFGKTNFVNMLSVLSIYMREFPELKGRIKCIVIATDAGGDRAKSFKAVKNQIVKASNFPVPDRVMEIKGGEHGFPSVVVMLVPIEGLGGLETLCVQAFSAANEVNAKVTKCQGAYFKCCPTEPGKWEAETHDKAVLQCLIAASCKENPSMPTSWAFSERGKQKVPVLDIGASAFNEIAEAMKKIVAKTSAP